MAFGNEPVRDGKSIGEQAIIEKAEKVLVKKALVEYEFAEDAFESWSSQLPRVLKELHDSLESLVETHCMFEKCIVNLKENSYRVTRDARRLKRVEFERALRSCKRQRRLVLAAERRIIKEGYMREILQAAFDRVQIAITENMKQAKEMLSMC
ncbi:hypothetical protein CORC01_00956 [Colletotrichum orchidophilum]|uniref:Uncharacterized protein n=1 Tax=Colletotrichum orchidophilum TaxID=1209926 RepID=A0A1G4BQS4_9PEZI|nr:uncharacterized protein CORC01_00956 [Colletotrichum orchidophilum]OHF03637.1 hypothetical protein CORC01_00956 [Colletotrichum orchidophilum]